MKFFKNLFGHKDDDRPVWNVTPADKRPAPRGRSSADTEPAAESSAEPGEKEENPFLTAAFEQFELVNDADERANPYSSHSWHMDTAGDMRKLKAGQIDRKRKRRPDDEFNPYETGVFRRGWKKD